MRQKRAVCFDRDGVVAKKGTWWEDGAMKTYQVKDEVREKMVRLSEKCFVCITSGRSIGFLRDEWGEAGISLHGEIGNIVWYNGEKLEEKWSDEEVGLVEDIRSKWRSIDDNRIIGFEAKEKIVTMHCRERIVEAEEMVRDKNLYCWWNGEAYDVGLKRVNKLTGIIRWAGMVGVPRSEVVMVGHGINDQGAIGGVGQTVNVADDEELGGQRVMDELLKLL